MIRYLKGDPRLIYRFAWQKDDGTLDAIVDTDFAGCRTTRRSTSGGVLMRGGHCLRHWSSTQTTIALSSGEAELGGISKGLSQAIWLRSIARDLGLNFSLTLRTDATAAIGISRRLGVCKIRHLDTSLLWVQDHVGNGDVQLLKVLGTEHPGDSLTTYLSGPDMRGHLSRMNLAYREGRAESAPELTTALTTSLIKGSLALRKEKRCRG